MPPKRWPCPLKAEGLVALSLSFFTRSFNLSIPRVFLLLTKNAQVAAYLKAFVRVQWESVLQNSRLTCMSALSTYM